MHCMLLGILDSSEILEQPVSLTVNVTSAVYAIFCKLSTTMMIYVLCLRFWLREVQKLSNTQTKNVLIMIMNEMHSNFAEIHKNAGRITFLF